MIPIDKRRLASWRSYVDLAGFLAVVSLKREARANLLSYAWWIIEPLSQLLLYYVAFGILMGSHGVSDNYLAVLFCGLVAWRWFTIGVMLGSGSLVSNGAFLKSFRLPTAMFVLSAFFESVVRSLPIWTMMIAYCLATQKVPLSGLGWLVVVLAVQMLLILAVTTLTSWLVVYVPDLIMLIDIGLRAGLFLSGVFYSVSSLSPAHQELMLLNPMAVIIDSYRAILVFGGEPHVWRLAVIAVVSLVVAVGNYYAHRRLSGRLAAFLT